MRTHTFKRNFKKLGFRTPDWQRARYLVKLPLSHVRYIKKRISDKIPKFHKKDEKVKK